jgi:FdhE protein
MHRTTRGLRNDPDIRLADLGRQRPEWQAWLRLLGDIRQAMDDPDWEPRFAETTRRDAIASPAPPQAPLLHGRSVEVDSGRIQRLVRRLATSAAGGDATSAASLRRYRPTAADAVALLAAAVRHDQTEIEALAARSGVNARALAAVAYFAALPLLHGARRRLDDGVPPYWPHSYCPICAALPILVEQRGLDRTRWLRCGYCGGEWQASWLCCVYCGEQGHDHLGSLVPDDSGDRLKVETCATCHGYVKSVATLQAISPFELLLQDLETVELDLVALDRGYFRPQGSSFALDVQVTSQPRRLIQRVLRNG